MTSINRIERTDLAEIVTHAQSSSNMLDVYQRIATKSAVYPGCGTPLGLMYCALKLNGEAGELAEHIGKAFRDDNLLPEVSHYAPLEDSLPGEVVELRAALLIGGKLTDDRRRFIIKELGDNLWYLSAICNELGIDLSDVAVGNIEKLFDRTERDALRGSGDER